MNLIKERPILFSSAMIRAILDGRKTQTRRVIKQELVHTTSQCGMSVPYFKGLGANDEFLKDKCPFGKVGDSLWVRETWQRECDGDGSFVQYLYKTDDQDLSDWVDVETDKAGIKWKPSIFMPRIASRLTLEITNVRVERIQDISEYDAKREGVTIPDVLDCFSPYKTEFKKLWNGINCKRGFSWESNPFVWAIEFQRVEVNQ